MKKKEKNNNKKLIVVIAIVLLLSVVGITLAYFVGQIGSGATANINVTTATVDTLTFTTGADVSIGPVTQQNFAEGQPNQSGSTTASAQLRANSTTNSATETYNLYVNITNNTFHKTSNNAELILTITDPTNTAVTSLSGLTYTTVKGVSGFDVTEEDGLIQIASDYTISVPNQANNPKTDTWNITLTFVNLDSDQTDNAGASFSAQAIIQKEVYELPTYYWNASFDGAYYSYPLGQKSTNWGSTWTSGSPTTYPTLAQLQNNYAQFTTNPMYIKTTDKHEACLYYNNHEFCLGPNYWVGDSQDQTDGTTTKNKLKTAMESALGTSADRCASNGYDA
uniref:hypothetical protein n=1 Tax=Candidatus Ruminimicrobium bovinum TaxID=3242779 RepID=UPI0039B974C9